MAPYGYWPCEDSSGAQEIASALSGVAAMGFTGTPSFGSDSSFGGSDSIPAVSGSSWHGQTQAAETPPGAGSLTETTAGTYYWTCPPGVTAVTGVAVTGGGGGGGGLGQHARAAAAAAAAAPGRRPSIPVTRRRDLLLHRRRGRHAGRITRHCGRRRAGSRTSPATAGRQLSGTAARGIWRGTTQPGVPRRGRGRERVQRAARAAPGRRPRPSP